jgi:transcription elongation factor Elf1
MGAPRGCLSLFSPWRRGKRRRIRWLPAILACPHCHVANTVLECPKCGKRYVLTTAHIEGRPRDAEAKPVSHLRAVLLGTCDACIAQIIGHVPDAEMRQRTCPACNEEFLSHYGL